MSAMRPQLQQPSQPGSKPLLLLGAGLLASVLLRVPHYQHSLTFVDEGIYATIASEMANGGVLYRDIWCNHQPLALYFCKWIFQVAGSNSNALHIGSLLLAFCESWLLYLLGKLLFSPQVGGLAALVFAVASTTFYTPRIIGYTPEQLMIVFMTAALLGSFHALQKKRPGHFLWAGALAMAAAFSKPAAIPEMLIFALLILLYPGLEVPGRFRAALWLACGMAVALILVLWELASSGTVGAWWAQSVSSRVYYVNQFGWEAALRQLVRQPVTFGLVFLWAWLLLWAGRCSDSGKTSRRFVLMWLLTAFAGVLVGRRFYGNYYIQVFPALSLLSGLGLSCLLEKGFPRRKVWIIATALAFGGVFLWFQSRTFAHCYFLLSPSAHAKVTLWEMCIIDRNQAEVARILRSATRPEDRLFVWGPSPEYYFLSGRRMATAFPFFDVMDKSQPPYGQEERQTLDSLERNPPAAIIDSFKNIKMAGREGWSRLLAESYRLYHEGQGVRIYLRR
jgi:4-amino-4-deoxy-L-arabinose transferase-like glycosyltransferase